MRMQDGGRKIDDVKERCNLMQHVHAHVLCAAALYQNTVEKQTARSTIIHEKLQVTAPFEEPPAFYKTRIFITVFITSRHLSFS
jgi:hypothetical protein